MTEKMQVLLRCRDACEKMIERTDATKNHVDELDSAMIEQLSSATEELEAATPDTSERRRSNVSYYLRTRASAILRFGWWLPITVIAVGCLIWWYEFRPVWQAERDLQGSWQYTTGVGHDEKLDERFFHVDESETWFMYPRNSKWTTQRSRIKLRPARDFFVVTREYDFGGANTYKTEYVVRLANDSVYMVRGMTQLDGMKEREIEKLRRIDTLPPEAEQEITTKR